MSIKTEHLLVSDIASVCIYENKTEEKKPIVMLLHGAGSTKESGLEVAKKLASLGFFAVVFDAYGYGESPYSGHEFRDPMDIFVIYKETSSYINRLIHHLANHPSADTQRVGLTGFSMGAHIIYYYLAHELIDQVKVAVPVAGSPRWDNIARRFILTIAQFNHLKQENVIQEYEARVSAIHPLPSLKKLSDFPLLISTGEFDDKIPVEDLNSFYQQIVSNYTNKDRVKLNVYPDAGHKFTEEMMRDGLQWLIKYLIS